MDVKELIEYMEREIEGKVNEGSEIARELINDGNIPKRKSRTE